MMKNAFNNQYIIENYINICVHLEIFLMSFYEKILICGTADWTRREAQAL